MSEPLPARNLGLDILRSLAIGLVLVAHALSFFTRWTAFDLNSLYYVLGFLGVELFFALSGFLIGRILVETVLSERSWPSLRRFYVRRWLRTLPPYYLVLALLPLLGHRFNWNSLVFLQNFSRKDLEFFPVSWSLSIEEWFYLLMPLAAPLGGALGPPQARGGFLHGVLRDHRALARGAVPLCLRVRSDLGFRHPQEAAAADGQPHGRRGAGGRFDLPAAGVGSLARSRRALFPVATLGLLATGGYQLWSLYHAHAVDTSVYARTILFLLVSLFAGALLLCLETSESVNGWLARRRWTRVFHFLSVTSYAAYLLHLEIFDLFEPLAARAATAAGTFAFAAVALAVTLLLSAAMYRWFEKPILRLRDRLTG